MAQETFASALASGRAKEPFLRWAAAQGARPEWLREPQLPLAPEEAVVTARSAGWLAAIDNRKLGFLLVEAGGGRARPGAAIDVGVSLQMRARLGDAVEPGRELARLYLRRPDARLVDRCRGCFTIGEEAAAVPPLVYRRVP